MITDQRKILGNEGEAFVADYLARQGFKILERNYAKKYGEIDLIAGNHEYVLFIEVKTRRSCLFDLSTVITKSKQRKMILVAKEYLVRHTNHDKMCRFDVALLMHNGNSYDLTYLPGAFTEQDTRGSY